MEMVEWFEDGKPKKRKFSDTAQGKIAKETLVRKNKSKGLGSTLSPKQKLKDDQAHDQKEIDKNKPSEAKTDIQKVKIVDDEWKFKGKSSIGGNDPGLNVYQVRGD